jgi:hypothetical protein
VTEQSLEVAVSGVQQYGADNWRAEFAAAIGTPSGAMQSTQGVYAREFTHGYAIVNPTANAVSFTLPSGSFQDSYASAVSGSVSLAPDSAVVLLDTAGPRC